MTAASALWICVFLCGVPAVMGLLVAMPKFRRPMLMVMAFATCHIKKPFYQEVMFEVYRGVDRGFGVTIPDLIFFGLAFYHVAFGRKTHWLPFNTVPYLLLIGISSISVLSSMVPYHSLFTYHKLLRCLVLYWAVVNVVQDRDDVKAIIMGLLAALVFQGGVVVFDKYVTKTIVNRSVGSFPHPNTLAMYVDLILPVGLSLYLSDALTKRQQRLAVAAVMCGIICVLFTKSRASLVIMIGALGASVFLSVVRRPTGRKFGVIAAGTVVLSIIGAIIAPRMIARFQNAPKESAETRVYFNDAAKEMVKDHPFGVGLNAYSWALGNTEYYWNVYPDKLDLPDPEAFRESKQGASRLGTAHHIYLLWAAETGWLGMIFFMLWIGLFYLKNLILYVKSKRDEFYGAVLAGMLVGTATLHLQGLLEWIFRQTQVFYLYVLMCGLMVAIGHQMKPKKRRAVAA